MKSSEYQWQAVLCKALSDPNRLMIMDMLSQGELCACDLLESLNITQPTLSHHMKILCDCELVAGHKDGKWMHYTLNTGTLLSFGAFIEALTSSKEIQQDEMGVHAR